jgi:hypothetical protein
MCECSNLGSIFYGKKAEDITELVSVIYEINTNYKTWETEYVCKVCGQKWLEKFESRGHGDVPVTMKIF